MQLVSIIMAAYNAEKTIAETVESLLAQTYPYKEIIITNDGSTDNTPRILDRFSEQHPNIIKIIHQKNMGQSIARNASIAATSGAFVAFMDADDIWAENKIERQVQYFSDHPEISMIYTEGMTIDEKGNKLNAFNCSKEFTGNCFETLFLNNDIIGSSVMVRKAVLDKVGTFTPYLRACENWELWTRISREHQIDFIDEELAYYRQHDSNMSQNIDWMIENRLKAIRHNHAQYKDIVANEGALTNEAYFRAYRGFGGVYLGQLELKKARRYIALAIKHNPKSLRMYLWLLQAYLGKNILTFVRKLKNIIRPD
ncbi:MAG: glycosyltransferase [Emcibacter sp.]|nr:glycosyltransferase [Emcibacter sp.]